MGGLAVCEIVKAPPVLPAQLDNVFKAPVRHKSRNRALSFQDCVGGHRRSVNDVHVAAAGNMPNARQHGCCRV